MGKLLTFLSIVILTMMSVGAITQPQNTVFWLASVTQSYQYVREILIAILVIQFVTRPPRLVWFRLLSGGISTITVLWVIQQTISYQMQLFDTLALTSASIAIIITSLERRAIDIKLHYNLERKQTKPGLA